VCVSRYVDGQTMPLVRLDVARLQAYTRNRARAFVPPRLYASSCQRGVRRCSAEPMGAFHSTPWGIEASTMEDR
jgi:hypothetical protein